MYGWNHMKYAISYLFINEKHEHFIINKFQKFVFGTLAQAKIYRLNDCWLRFKSFCIWFYMIGYDVYHRKTMFKVISIITKPWQHSKYYEMWRNISTKLIKNNLVFSILTSRNDALDLDHVLLQARFMNLFLNHVYSKRFFHDIAIPSLTTNENNFPG